VPLKINPARSKKKNNGSLKTVARRSTRDIFFHLSEKYVDANTDEESNNVRQ